MIPRKVHYFWFSNEKMPEKLQLCLQSWQEVLSDYEIIKWDLENTVIDSPFAEMALKERKWAFLTDYCRLKTLYEYGGIYLDTDVFVVKPFNELLHHQSFWGTANNGMVEPVVVGAEPDNKLVKECLKRYQEIDIYSPDFSFQEIPKIILPVFHEKGFEINPHRTQIFDDGVVFPFDFFCPMPFEKADSNDFSQFKTGNTFAIHLWNANWFDPFRFFWNGRYKAGWRAVWKVLKNNPFQGFAFYRNILFHIKMQVTRGYK